MYNLRWRLLYADDSTADETVEGSSIKNVRPGAVAIQLVSWSGGLPRTVSQVLLNGERPVFYRRRSIDANVAGPIRTDAIVFGRGRETNEGFTGDLWKWEGDQAINCPRDDVDQTMIEWLVSNG